MSVQLLLLFSLCISAKVVLPLIVRKKLDMIKPWYPDESRYYSYETNPSTGGEVPDESEVFPVQYPAIVTAKYPKNPSTTDPRTTVFAVLKTDGRRLSLEEELKLVTDNIDSLDEFFFGRYFRTENMTCQMYETTVKELEDNMANELEICLTDIRRELEMADDQGNPGCIEGINNKLSSIVAEEAKIFKRRSQEALSNSNLLKQDLDDKISLYEEKKSYTLAQLQNCKSKFAGHVLWEKRKQCYEQKKQEFINFAKQEADFHSSPCMTGFRQYEMDAITKTLTRFTQKINKELKSVTCCKDRLVPLNLNTTIFEQVNTAKNKYNELKDELEATMRRYYRKEVDVLNEQDLQPRTEEWFRKDLEGSLAVYMKAVEDAAWYNNDAPECGAKAVESLDNIFEKESAAYAAADKVLVEDTIKLMGQVREDFASINNELPSYGDVAILDCFTNNQLFGDHSITDCYELKYLEFMLQNNETTTRIVQTVQQLESYNFNQLGSHTPKGKVYQKRILLTVVKVLKDQEKCIYKTTGRRYKVRPGSVLSTTFSMRKTEAQTQKYFNLD